MLDFLSTPSRQAAALEETDHRPWPLPNGRWTIAQTWEDLLFAHWRIPAEALHEIVPPPLTVDRFEGDAWLGVTPFVISGFRLRGTLPVPRLSTFPEINVRTYVTHEEKPGIWFFSLDTSSPLAVEGARAAYKLPYFHARMSVRRAGERVEYSSARRNAEARPFVFEGTYRPTGDASAAEPGSREHFLTERYCLYAADARGLYRAEIHHQPWDLQQAEAKIELNTMTPEGIELADEEPLLHFSGRQDVVIWPLEPLT